MSFKGRKGIWTATYVGTSAMARLEVFPNGSLGLYRGAVYEWFDRRPLYVSGADSILADAKADVQRLARYYAGLAVSYVIWES